MPKMPPTHVPGGRTARERRLEQQRRHDEERRTSEARKLYHTARWRRLRAERLTVEPACRYCLAESNVLTPANVCDHVVPHKGDLVLFWDFENTQSLCTPHHNGRKAREERGNATTKRRMQNGNA